MVDGVEPLAVLHNLETLCGQTLIRIIGMVAPIVAPLTQIERTNLIQFGSNLLADEHVGRGILLIALRVIGHCENIHEDFLSVCLLRLELCLELLNLVDIALIDFHELSVWLVIDELDRIAELIFLVVQLLCQTVISNTA